MSQNDDLELQEGNSKMVESWIVSLIPISVAFVFYLVFIMTTNLPNKGEFIAYGAAAGFVGLESYWVVQGVMMQKKRIIIMGLSGIALTIAVILLLF